MIVKSKVKYINSLGDKKQRDADGVFIAEGPKIINELLDEPEVYPVEIFALREWIDQQQNSSYSNITTEVDEVLLSRLSFMVTPNQVMGIFRKIPLPPLQLSGTLTVVLDGIQDPGNLGTIVRCADWFGVTQIVCSSDSADIYNPKTVQSTMGSVARVKVYYEDIATVLSNSTVATYATALSGKNVLEMGKLNEGLIIIGNESRGVRKNVLSMVRERITIPKYGKAESLNAAVATGIVLAAICPSPLRNHS